MTQGKYGIIYCFSRKDTEMLYSKLYDYGFKNDCFYYHAGLTTADRNKNSRTMDVRLH